MVAFMTVSPEFFRQPRENEIAAQVNDESQHEQQRPDEEQHVVVRTAEHDLGHFGGNRRRERANRIGKPADTIAAFPDAISTIIVSPMARPNPSTIPAAMPGKAAGSTIVNDTCQGLAPSAAAASRSDGARPSWRPRRP